MGEDRLEQYECHIVPEEYQDQLFVLAWPFLRDGYRDGMALGSQAELFERIKDGFIQLWFVAKEDEVVGALITEIVYLTERKKRVLHSPLGGGDIVTPVATIIERLEEFARAQDVQEVRFTVRPGLGKVTRDYGYRTRYIEMGRDLETSNE